MIRLFTLALLLAGLLPTAMAADTIAVKAVPLQQVVTYPEISAPATVVSLSDSRIGAELNAPIQTIAVRVGDVVEPDSVLVRLDCDDYQLSARELKARLAGTEARIGFARQQLKRVKSLRKHQTVSQEQLDERESGLTALLAERDANQAGLDRARRNLDKCAVRSPFKALVLERLASVGEYARPGSPLIRVLDITQLEISADVLMRDAPSLADAKAVVFRTDERDYPVGLRVLTPAIDTATHTREARLMFDSESALPGATGRLVWSLSTALPADLLVRRNGQLGVLLAEHDRARFHPVPGAQEGRSALVNLPLDVLVVTEGRFALDDGDAVEVVN